jgi:DNA-binding response OmpR family regulator
MSIAADSDDTTHGTSAAAILVIDPSGTLHGAIRLVLSDRPIDVVLPASTADPLEAYARYLPDLVVATIASSADDDRTHALRRLHAAVPCQLVVIVPDIATAHAAAVWADGVVIAPVDAVRLGVAIDTALRSSVPSGLSVHRGERVPSAPDTPDASPRGSRARGRRPRRGATFTTSEPVRWGPFSIDESTRTAACDGRVLPLTRTEFDLLRLFMDHPEHVLSRAQIVEQVWGAWVGSHHLVDVHLSRLRRKIAIVGGLVALPAVRGVGFRLLAPAED